MKTSRRRAGRTLIGVMLALAIVAPSPADADPVRRWRPFIAEAAARFDVPATWVERVMRAESGGRTRLGGRPTVSHAGAMGLMQLMPATWAELRIAHRLGGDPHDPRDNIIAGTAYLRAMYDRFGYPGLFAAYNAGPARYAAHLATGRPLPGETRAYVAQLTSTERVDQVDRVDRLERNAPPVASSVRSAGMLFFPLATIDRAPVAADRTDQPTGLFISLSPR